MTSRAVLALAAFALLATAGCLNVALRPNADANEGPYAYTCAAAKAVKDAFVTPEGPEGGIEHAICSILAPIMIVDTPLEAVADTILLPWDAYRTLSR